MMLVALIKELRQAQLSTLIDEKSTINNVKLN